MSNIESMIVSRRDLDFILYEVFNLDILLDQPRYEYYDRESIASIFDVAQQIAEDKYLPCAAKLDANEPTFDGERVSIIPEVKEAIDVFREAGFFAAGFDYDVGGMQLPLMVQQGIANMFSCANNPINSYAFLTIANANMLLHCGSQELIDKYFPPMLDGRWFGTMCLSEPQAGSSLSDIRTKAEPMDDGSYKLYGTKMWISGGEHELSENIIHMVLAKIPGGPSGVKGISLFLVPKYRVNDDGSLGEHNNVVLAGINHKMGNRGTVNTLLNFGESGDCIGYLVGKEHQGLANMFFMMNEARIGVGSSAVVAALGGYLYSLDYSRNRPQGRLLNDKNPDNPQVMIIEHNDVKRMLMTQKVFVEGGLALIYYCASLIDRQKLEKDNQQLVLLLEILTPIAKSWPSEFCLEANKLAIQVLGGYGYTREYPVERLYRDNRLNHIHEGTWAIHGLDILGRKVHIANGAALMTLGAEIQSTIDEVKITQSLQGYASELEQAWATVGATIQQVFSQPDIDLSLANATIFLDAMGHVVVAWLWLKQAVAADKGLATNNEHDIDFYNGKLAACRFFYHYELPKALTQLQIVSSLDDTCHNLNQYQFVGY